MQYLRPPKLKMGLKKGMLGREIAAELRGRTNGETKQATQLFLHRCENEGKDAGSKNAVINTNEQYALVFNPRMNDLSYTALDSFALVGVTDEETYFVRPLWEAPRRVLYEFGDLLDWVNKADLGFGPRLQGDILYQFVPRKRECQSVFCSDKLGGLVHKITLSDCRYHIELPGHDLHENFMQASFKNESRNIGNHTVTVHKGLIHTNFFFYPGMGQILFIEGDRVVMTHAEHKPVWKDIPDGQLMLITQQRGGMYGMMDGD